MGEGGETRGRLGGDDRRRPFAGLGSFVVILAGILLALRAAHVVVPLLVPSLLPGPIRLARLDQVRETVGFAPLVPFYRPELLGAEPVAITIDRRPHPRVRIRWQDVHWLEVTLTPPGAAPPHPPEAEPLAAIAGALTWTDGDHRLARVERDGLAVTLETDLPARDLPRLVDSLRPYRELL